MTTEHLRQSDLPQEPTHETFFDRTITPIVQIRNPLVVHAFRQIDRGNFMPPGEEFRVYEDEIIPMGETSSMSQPSLMAVMLDFLELSGSEKVLEIGTASGYNAALLSLCAAEVHTIESDQELATTAQAKLQELRHAHVHVHLGDGAQGLPDQAPFDRIILTAAAREFPQLLFDQLKDGGVIVGPVGETQDYLKLAIGKKAGNTLTVQYSERVSFISLDTSEHGGWNEEAQAKERRYQLEESYIEVAYPWALNRNDLDRVLDEGDDLEPNPECLDILTKHGLTPEQFVNIFKKLGEPENRTRKLLSLHPESFEFLVNMALFTHPPKRDAGISSQ